MTDMTLEQLAADAETIRYWYSPENGKGYEQHVVAAARLVATVPLILRKIASAIDSDGWIDWPDVVWLVENNAWSTGETAIIRFACSLAGYAPEGGVYDGWRIDQMLESLDAPTGLAAAEAIRYATQGPE